MTDWTILDQAHEALRTAVHGVAADAWGNPTPCEQWNVTQVLQHAAGDQMAYAANITGGAGPSENPSTRPAIRPAPTPTTWPVRRCAPPPRRGPRSMPRPKRSPFPFHRTRCPRPAGQGALMIRILIADDHTVIRDGLTAMLEPHQDFHVVGEAADGVTAVQLASRTRPDVVLMDLRMPRLDGAPATAQITALSPAPHVLVLTTYDSDTDILRAMSAGAIGYLLKDTPRQELFEAIRSAAQGRAALTPSVATRLVRRQHAGRTEALSARERQVLLLVADGLTNKEAAVHLQVGEATVKTYLARIFTKLDVNDRTAAVTTALASN